jgi:ubiquinone/menaquinone biosynthesis C-methylase UbiE
MSDADHDYRIVNQFSRWAAAFASEPIHADSDGMARTLAACDLATANLSVLDVACGPGIVACALAPYAASVSGIDLTPLMIEQARSHQKVSGLTNMDWQVSSATALPFAEGSFDRVVTRYSLHHMEDPFLVVREMARVCKPGGRVIVIDATPSPESQAAYDAMETLRDSSHTSALTPDQLAKLGRALQMPEVARDFYWLEARLDRLADTQDMAELTAMFERDIAGGQDLIGVRARREEDGIYFHFPVSIIAWAR